MRLPSGIASTVIHASLFASRPAIAFAAESIANDPPSDVLPRMQVLRAAPLAVGLLACAPSEGPIEAPIEAPPSCRADEQEVEALLRELDEIEAAIMSGELVEIRLAATRLATLLEHPVFRTNEGRPCRSGADRSTRVGRMVAAKWDFGGCEIGCAPSTRCSS